MGLTKAAINRPVFILMVMLACLLIGYISFNSMRLELNPDVSFGTITVATTYPGAGPEEINNLVSRPIEESVSGVEGMREVTSTSREGQSVVVCNFEIGVDTDKALNDVRSKVDTVTSQLPKDALKPIVTKLDTSSQPVLYLAFNSGKLSSEELRDLIDDKLKDRFAQISGVAAADVLGGDVRELQVRVKKDKLLQFGIGIADVQRAVSNSTLNVPAGKLNSGDQEFAVRVQGEFQSVDELRKLVFSVTDPKSFNSQPKIVHLSDVADIQDTVRERTQYARLNGKDSIVLALSKTKEGNAVSITDQADQAIQQIQKEYATDGLTILKTVETAKQIKDSIHDVTFAVMFGIVLVAIIVYVFLHNFRGMLIVCLAIPTSIMCTFIAMKAMGFTINNLSMLALSLAIGVLVDDAIVVLENINRHLKAGEDPKEAALNGRSEIGMAAIAITLADVVVFTPIGFMGGIVGQFFKPLALGFVAATLFSLFVSFTLTPMLASRWYRAGEDMEAGGGRFAHAFEKLFGRFEHFYRGILEWALNHRWFVFTLGNLALFTVITFIIGGFAALNPQATLIGTMASMSKPIIAGAVIGLVIFGINAFRGYRNPKFILYGALFACLFPLSAGVGYMYGSYKKDAVFKFQFIPTADSGQVAINVELPPGSNLARTESVVREIESRVKDIQDVKYVTSNVGGQSTSAFSSGNSGSNFAQVALTLYDKGAFLDKFKKQPEPLRWRSSDAVAAETTQKVGRIPGAVIRVSSTDAVGFGAAIQMSFTSDDRVALNKAAQTVFDKLEQGAVPGVINPELSSKPGNPELQAIPDRERLADLGLTVADIGGAIRTLYQGDDSTKYRYNGREYTIRVMMDYSDRDNPNVLNTVPVKFTQGNPLFLGSVAQVVNKSALDRIDRRNRVEEVRVNASLLPGVAAGSAQQSIDKLIQDQHLVPAGVNYKPLGQADAQARESGYMMSAFAMGLILVYMVLASLYDNLLYPLIIQMAQPQAMVGALLALVFTDKAFSLIGFIGLVALVGLVGKNAILLVDYTNTLRERGLNRHDAIVQAAPLRLRPIAMTTMALVLAMLPVALAIGRGSEFRETIGITIIGGISLSTLLTLLVIPCSYTIFDDISIGIGTMLRRMNGRRPTPPPTTTSTDEDTTAKTTSH